MALTDENGGMNTTMLVSPAGAIGGQPYPVYMNGQGGGNNGGFGDGNGWWILLLFILLAGGNGWGNGYNNGGFAGSGNTGYNSDFPWLLNGQNGINANVNDGFRDAQLHDSVTSVRDGISSLSTQLCGCCGDIQMGIAGVNQGVASAAAGINQNISNVGFGIQNSLCQGFAGTSAAITAAQNGVTQQLYNNEIANLNRSFAEQTANAQGFNGVQAQLAQCCCDNHVAANDLKYTIATENCADRTQSMQNTRDIIDSQTRSTQAILDKLCQLELDGVKAQVEAKNDRIADLQNQLNMASFRESQVAQNAFISQGLNQEVDALYNRLSNCPVPSTPVYGRTPIFTCPQNQNSCGCGCGNNGF